MQQNKAMKGVLLGLLLRLEAVGERHEELYDSEVRESMDAAVGDGFLKPQSGYALPDAFGLFSDEGNQSVREALAWFLAAAGDAAASDGLDTFKTRLAAFQDLEVRTSQQNDCNDFFGWANPDDYDGAGRVLPR